jgi:4-hydroxybenzoate polyprenyltransferase
MLCIFIAGAIVMRAAGCIANDLADRNLDGHVERTRLRPLVTGALSVKEAFGLLGALLILALILVALTNALTMKLSFVGAGSGTGLSIHETNYSLATNRFGSRFFVEHPRWHLPPVSRRCRRELWWLFCANVLWTLIYDTQYAMVDREDDLAIGIKSTAILFRRYGCQGHRRTAMPMPCRFLALWRLF